MHKSLAMLCLLAVTSPATAGGPPVAIAKGSSTSEIYLMNADGTGSMLLYKAPGRKKLFSIAVRPGGNELAAEEVDCCKFTGTTTLRIVRYNDFGERTGIGSLTLPCRIGSLDYHRSDGTLLMAGCNGRLSVINTTTFSRSDIVTGKSVSKASWMSGSKIFLAASPSLYTFDLAPAAGTPALVRVADEDAVVSVDASPDGARGLVSVADPARSIKLVSSLTSGATLSTVALGHSPSFSTDGSSFAYITVDNRGQFVRVRPIGSTSDQTIASKGSYSSVSWADTGDSATDFGIRAAP